MCLCVVFRENDGTKCVPEMAGELSQAIHQERLVGASVPRVWRTFRDGCNSPCESSQCETQ